MKFTANIPQGYLLLLSLLTCSYLLDVGHNRWLFAKTAAFIALMVVLQFFNYRLWWATALASISFLLTFLPSFPRLTNHGNLEVFISFTLLLCIGLHAYKKRAALPPEIINLAFRWTLIMVYFWAGFAKLNAGFFDISGSCATEINYRLYMVFFNGEFIPPDYIIRLMQAATILMEMVVPFGLLHHKTRKAAVWLLLIFHFHLSLCRYANFSALAVLLLSGSMLNFGKGFYSQALLRGLSIYQAFCIMCAVCAYFLSRTGIVEPDNIRFYSGLIFNIGMTAFMLTLIDKSIGTRQNYTFSFLPVLPVLFITLWASQPYIGLSNTANLTMFSNLVTEKSRSNHYLVDTGKTKIWEFEENYVTVLQMPDYAVKGRELEGYDLPMTEFKRRAGYMARHYKDNGPFKCTILYKGKKLIINDIATSSFGKPRWWYQYIYFRKIPQPGVKECLW